MKLELKTENEKNSKSFRYVFMTVFSLAIIIILCDVSLKIGIISRHYQIDFNCRVLSADKSTSNFKKISRLSNLKSKQKIWELCREVIK